MENKQYDLSLGDVGPYNKEYLGVCHIADKTRGATFNIEMFPGFFRRSVTAPATKWDNGVKMWGANADLTRFIYRYELQHKDKIYCDVDFNITKDRRVDIECTFVNNTDAPQTIDMVLCASLQLPTSKPGSETLGYRDFYTVQLPGDCICIDATDYQDIKCRNTIASDGMKLGEDIFNGASGKGTVVFCYYFYDKEHYLKYSFNRVQADSIGIRCSAENDTALLVKTDTNSYRIEIKASKDLEYYTIPIKEQKLDKLTLCPTGKEITIDSICIGKSVNKVEYKKIPHEMTPEKTIQGNTMTLKYKDIPHSYNIVWHQDIRVQRRLCCYDVGKLLAHTVNDHCDYTMYGSGKGVYEAVYTSPLYLSPNTTQQRSYTVYIGDAIAEKEQHQLYTTATNPDGNKYLFSQQMMGYNTLLNVVYPIYTKRQYIKHNTPGRFWDSLYSWDSGFIGMGLARVDFRRGYECLNTYLVPVGDKDSPYIFHGSVVPTQVFLYKYLIDNFPGHREELARLYPMMKQYYDFYANMDKQPDQTGSGLLKTWSMSYNSGGWDDYPPQDHLRKGKDPTATHHNTTPVITTAYTVLISEIMMLIAPIMGHSEDVEYYRATAQKYTSAIHQNKLWDSQSGYFSYMVHDRQGRASEQLRYKDGTNYNMGMDGITPYIADICTQHQQKAIISNIKEGLMTHIGVGVVDKRAPYYSKHGYWNGTVWMPHQWILWKALIDKGEWELVYEIAHKALEIWANEVGESYCCFEHFMCHNGRGSGFHQFSGLSCPITLFFAGCYTPGTITTGFASITNSFNWSSDHTVLNAEFTAKKQNSGLLVCMNSKKQYKFVLNQKPIIPQKLTDGTYCITLEKGSNYLTVE